MKCPFCEYEITKVLESRSKDEESSIRRRRECEGCKKRFTTYERIESTPVLIAKRSGSREPYLRQKLQKSLMKSCNKCNLPEGKVNEIVDEIESKILTAVKKEIKSTTVGEYVLQSLKKADNIAYIRYLSIFKKFQNLDDFLSEIDNIKKETLA